MGKSTSYARLAGTTRQPQVDAETQARLLHSDAAPPLGDDAGEGFDPALYDAWLRGRSVCESLRFATEAGSPSRASLSFVPAGAKINDPARSYDAQAIVDDMDRRAAHMRDLGMRAGDKVGLAIPDPEEFVLTFLALMGHGFIPVPMYPPMGLGKLEGYLGTVSRILQTAQAKWLIADSRVAKVLWSLVDVVPNLEGLVQLDALQGAPKQAIVPPPKLDPDATAFLQFTSGSTADPKGVVVTHRSLSENLYAIMHHGLEVNRSIDKTLSWLPLYHDMGLIGFMMAPVWYGIPAVFLPTLDFVKKPARWMAQMAKHRATISFAPNFAFALAAKRTPARQLEELDLSCVRVLGCGSEPNHPATLRHFIDHFGEAGLPQNAVLPVYGMAEATLAMAFTPLDAVLPTDIVEAEPYHASGLAQSAASKVLGEDVPKDSGDGVKKDSELEPIEFVACGGSFPDHHIYIVGPDDKTPLPERQVGEVVFCGPSVAKEYFLDPTKTSAVFQEDGLRTGDLGYIADGNLFVTGRKKDVVILNGRNYDPQTIEWAAASVAGIRKGNVVAFCRPGAASEELVVVAESTSPEDETLKAAVCQKVQEELFLRVSDLVLLPAGALPKTSSGKLQRSKARLQYLQGTLGEEGVRTMGAQGSLRMLVPIVLRSMKSRMRQAVRSRWRKLLGKAT